MNSNDQPSFINVIISLKINCIKSNFLSYHYTTIFVSKLTYMIAPSKNDVETPKPIQMIETPSMISPSRPKIFLPNTG